MKTLIAVTILFASCKTVVPNAPKTAGNSNLYKVEKVSYKNGQTIAKVTGFRYWQVVNDTVKAGDFIPVVKVK